MRWDPLATKPAWRAWLTAVLAGAVCALFLPGLLLNLRPPREKRVDYFQDWASAQNFLHGVPVYTRHSEIIERYLGYIPDPTQEEFVERNAHPPPCVLLALGLAWLDYPEAVLAWNLVSLAALVATLWLMNRELPELLANWSVLSVAALLLLANPIDQQFVHGQINLVLLLLIVGAWAAERRGAPGWAGVLAGTATALKLFPGLLLIYFALRGQWKALAAGAATFLAVTAATAAILGWQSYQTYVFEVLPEVSQFRGSWVNASLTGFWSKLFDPGTGPDARHLELLWPSPNLARVATLLSSAVVLALWAPAVWRAASGPERDLAYGLTLITMLLISPTTWDHYLILLLLPLSLTCSALRSTAVKFLLVGIVACFWINPVRVWLAVIPGTSINTELMVIEKSTASPWHTLTVLSFQLYALAVLFGMGLALARRGRVADRVATPPGAPLPT